MNFKDQWIDFKARSIIFFGWLKKNKYFKKTVKILFFFLIFWILYLILKDPILNYAQSNEKLWGFIQHIKYQISNKTYLGLYYAGIVGAFIGLSMPVELISLYYFSNDYFFLSVILIAVFGIMTGLVIDYIIGFILGRRILKYFLKNKFEAFESKSEKYGGWLLFGLSLIVSPIDFFVLFYASLRYPFKKLIKIIFLGQMIKFFAIYFFLDFFTKTTLPILQSLI